MDKSTAAQQSPPSEQPVKKRMIKKGAGRMAEHMWTLTSPQGTWHIRRKTDRCPDGGKLLWLGRDNTAGKQYVQLPESLGARTLEWMVKIGQAMAASGGSIDPYLLRDEILHENNIDYPTKARTHMC